MNHYLKNGWRTVIAESQESLKLRDNQLIITCNEEEQVGIPIAQISNLMIIASQSSVTMPLVKALIENHVNVIICDEKWTPIGKFLDVGEHNELAGRLMDQSSWTDRRKKAVWKQIVQMKIENQMQLLYKLTLECPATLAEYRKNVQPDDATNREALAAKVYFDRLFGSDFIRGKNDAMNAALNYGYTILRSAFDRAICLHGYHPALGIHHCSRSNPYNLSCDLMEPFRPFVDQLVYQNPGRELDKAYKCEMIELQKTECLLDGKRMTLDNAIHEYTLCAMHVMLYPRQKLKEVHFA